MAVEIGTTHKDFYVRTEDLTFVLGVSAKELSELYQSSILQRIKPKGSKSVLYPVFDSVRRYCAYQKGKRQAIHQEFLTAKAGRERAQQLRVERENRVAAGELVDKHKLFARLEPIIVAFREQMLSRADRLEREITRTKSRKEKVAAIRAADSDALNILSDLFKVASNGAR
jgi:hypothetical protein